MLFRSLKGELNLKKRVVGDQFKLGIVDWMIDSYDGDPLAVLADITFELYNSNAAGDKLTLAATGTLDTEGMITFSPGVGSGWYLVHEVLGNIAKNVFEQPEDMLVQYNGRVITVTPAQRFADGTAFTIQQFFGAEVSRPIQAIYEGGFYLRTTPKLNVPGAPNGGGAFNTSKFTATADDGEKFTSFCADIGAVGVKGTYYIDPTDHGFSAEEKYQLMAALDYIYDFYSFEEYEAVALAQLVVWNMILKCDGGAAISDNWIRRIVDDDVILYTDEFGKITKIEGYNNTNGKNYWYTPEYKALVDDIIANPEKYVEIYNARVGTADSGSFINDVTFLVGDQGALNIYQQRQVIVRFGEPVTFDNTPKNVVKSELSLPKMVAKGNGLEGIVAWLTDNYKGNPLDVLNDITLLLYKSNETGEQLDFVGAGIIDTQGIITFSPAVEPGWYRVSEMFGGVAADIFMPGNGLLLYFDGTTAFDRAGGEAVFVNYPLTK